LAVKPFPLKHGSFRFWIFAFVLVAALGVSRSASSIVLTVNDTSVPLSIDGHLKDWPECRMINLDQPSQVVEGKFFWKGKDDFSGRLFVTYDSEYLYLAAIVTRNGSPKNSNDKLTLWNGDCLEVFLSTDPDTAAHQRLTKSDYHIGISPGNDCRDPQIWCFNKNQAVPGARIHARNSKNGYILEAAIPLEFFSGLTIGPNRTCGFNVALDEGGAVSGNRLVQLDFSEKPNSWQNPYVWSWVQWIGTTQVSIPVKNETDENSILVADGTKGNIFGGLKTVTGLVTDNKGHPLSGARISTWPATTVVFTDDQGVFKVDPIKVYRQTVVYAEKDGYTTSLGTLDQKSMAATVSLSAMPVSLWSTSHDISPIFYGQNLSFDPINPWIPVDDKTNAVVKSLGLNVIRLNTEKLIGLSLEQQEQALDQFVAYAQSVGASPMIEIPIQPGDSSLASEWVNYCNVQKGEGVHYWCVGNEPDLYAQKPPDDALDNYNVYDYINDFRLDYNAMKQVDPTLVVLGPDLAFPAQEGEKDWLTPFLQFDGDIVNMVSVHHYACVSPDQYNSRVLKDDIRRLKPVFRALQGKVSENSDVYIPLVYSEENIYPQGPADPKPVTAAQDFSAALWQGDEVGTLLDEGVILDAPGPLWATGADGFLTPQGANPAYWIFKLFADRWKGHPLSTQVQKSDVSVYAAQDPQTKDVCLFIFNESPQYYWFNIAMNGQGNDLVVDAGLDIHFRYEVPDQTAVVLRIKADRSGGDAAVYSAKIAKAGQAPQIFPFKP
jgi:hypothetical protein